MATTRSQSSRGSWASCGSDSNAGSETLSSSTKQAAPPSGSRLRTSTRPPPQLGQHPPATLLGRLVRPGRQRQAQLQDQVAQQRQQLRLAFRRQGPQAAGIAVGPAVPVGRGQFCLALPAQPVHGGDHADGAQGQLLVQLPQLGPPADEVRVRPPQVARHARGPAGPLDPLPQAGAQRRDPLPHGVLAERLRAAGEPRPQVGVVQPRQLVDPAGEARRVGLLVAARHLDEVHRRDAVLAHQRMDLAARVFLPFPAAVRALEVVRRQADQQDPRVPQALQDPVPPVVHVADRRGVQEDPQRLGGKAAVVGLDRVAQGGDPTRLAGLLRHVVLPRIRDEDFVVQRGAVHGATRRKGRESFSSLVHGGSQGCS